jgi:phage replication-related protein YjqB (UPF0714/DUF867 family)
MTDTYTSYTDLAAHETEGVAYERRSVPAPGATWSAIAIHGGSIEPGSGEVARAIGAGLMNHYEFAGILSSGNSRLHVTSTNFDEPICTGIVTSALRCLSAHGYADTTPGLAQTSLGGLDTATMARVRDNLTQAGFSVITAAQEINGNDPANIANKTTISAGVQLEMSRALRDSFFPGGANNHNLPDRTDAFYAYVDAVRRAYQGQAKVAVDTINASRWATIPWGSPDFDIKAAMTTDKVPTGGSHFLHLGGRFTGLNDNYLARLEFSTTSTLTLTLRKRVAGTETLLATASANITGNYAFTPGRMFYLRFNVTGSLLSAKIWQAGQTEPDGWAVQTTDTSITAVGSVGIRSILSSANTNTLPVTFSYDDFQQISPQSFEVTRSVNGVVKSQTAGTPVNVDPAPIVAL